MMDKKNSTSHYRIRTRIRIHIKIILNSDLKVPGLWAWGLLCGGDDLPALQPAQALGQLALEALAGPLADPLIIYNGIWRQLKS